MLLSKRGREVNRLETFSDGVFAFSATLLVVSLEVPKTFPELASELKGFIAFGVSFAALVLIWSVHNAFFRRYGLHDRMTIIFNSCLLFVVLFYVYPLKFVVVGLVNSFLHLDPEAVTLNTIDELAQLFMLYSGGFVAVFLCIAALYLHAYHKRFDMNLNESEVQEALFHFRHYSIFVIVGLISVLTALLHLGLRFGLPGFIYMLLGPLCYFHAINTYRHKKENKAIVIAKE